MSDRLREQLIAGNQARDLLEHPAFVRAVERLENECLEGWRYTDPDQKELRELAWMRLKVLDDLRRELKITLDNGAIAAGVLEKQNA